MPDGKLLHKVEELAGGSASEAVYRLVGVAHRSNCVALTEKTGEQNKLGVGGVLELIQEHYFVAGTFSGGGERNIARNSGCERHEVAEIKDTAMALRFLVTDHHVGNAGACPEHGRKFSCGLRWILLGTGHVGSCSKA